MYGFFYYFIIIFFNDSKRTSLVLKYIHNIIISKLCFFIGNLPLFLAAKWVKILIVPLFLLKLYELIVASSLVEFLSNFLVMYLDTSLRLLRFSR